MLNAINFTTIQIGGFPPPAQHGPHNECGWGPRDSFCGSPEALEEMQRHQHHGRRRCRPHHPCPHPRPRPLTERVAGLEREKAAMMVKIMQDQASGNRENLALDMAAYQRDCMMQQMAAQGIDV